MSRILDAEAVVRAKDATGGVFEGIAAKIQRLNRAAKSLTSDLDKQIATANRVEQSLSRSQRVGQAIRRGGAYLGNSATAATAGALAIGSERAARALTTRSVKDAADRAHEIARADAAGMSAKEIEDSEKIAGQMSAKYKSLSATSIMHTARNIRSVVGNFEEATHILDPLMKLRVVAEGAHPERADELEKDFDQLTKGMEIKGVTQDMGKFTHYMDGMAKALNVFGDTLRPTDYYEMFKYGRAATTALSDDFMLKTAPTLAQELGGSSAGKALSSFYTQFVGGKMSNKAVAQLAQYGLLDESKVIKTSTGNVKGVLPGGVLGQEYLQPGKTDPYGWVNNVLLPKLVEHGVTDPAQQQEVIAAMASQQTTAQMMSIFATQQNRIMKDWGLIHGAKGLEAADVFLKTDPKTGAKAVTSQFDNLLTTASKPLVPKAVKGMDMLSNSLSNLTGLAEEHPTAAAWSLGGAIGGTLLAAGAFGKMALGSAGKIFRGEPVAGGGMLGKVGKFGVLGLLASLTDLVYTSDEDIAKLKRAEGLHPKEFGALSSLDNREAGLEGSGLRGSFYDAQKKSIADQRAAIEGQLTDLGYGPASLPGRGRMDTLPRSDLLDSLKPGYSPGGQEPARAVVEGNATLDVNVKVDASPELLAKVDQRVDNKINAFRSTNAPASGTAGSTGRSSPDATPPQ